jgi:hypothetical protein
MNIPRDGSEIELSTVATVSNDKGIVPQMVDDIGHLSAALNFPTPRGAYTLESARS